MKQPRPIWQTALLTIAWLVGPLVIWFIGFGIGWLFANLAS